MQYLLYLVEVVVVVYYYYSSSYTNFRLAWASPLLCCISRLRRGALVKDCNSKKRYMRIFGDNEYTVA